MHGLEVDFRDERVEGVFKISAAAVIREGTGSISIAVTMGGTPSARESGNADAALVLSGGWDVGI